MGGLYLHFKEELARRAKRVSRINGRNGEKEMAEWNEKEEKESLMEKVAILNFDMLCATVFTQSQKGKWGKLNLNENDGEEDMKIYANGGGVLRMWEDELIYYCFDDRCIAFQFS